MTHPLIHLLAGVLLLLPLGLVAQQETINGDSVLKDGEIVWAVEDGQGNIKIPLYFFWSANCPHCTKARPIIEQMAQETPWLSLYSLPVSEKRNRLRYQQMAASLGQDANSVPAFLFCGLMLTGFDEELSPPPTPCPAAVMSSTARGENHNPTLC